MGVVILLIHSRRSLTGFLMACFLGLSVGLPAENAFSAENALILTQLPVQNPAARAASKQHGPLDYWLLWPDFADGARLVKVHPDSTTQILSRRSGDFVRRHACTFRREEDGRR